MFSTRQARSFTVFGRDRETKALQDAFDRASDPTNPSFEQVVIRGSSGCGKSCLVSGLMKWAREERSGVDVQYGEGKSSQLTNNEPFAAIADACNDLCQEIRNHNKMERFQAVLQDMTSQREAINMLMKAIPGLRDVVGQEDPLAEQRFFTLSQAFTRFKQLWRNLVLAFSSLADVTVLFIDDVQWADHGSLDLMHSLNVLGLSEARRILVICAYRDDENLDKATRERLQWSFSLGDHKEQTTDIEVANLDIDGTAAMVNGLLFGPNVETKPKTRELSDAVYADTGGNPFFAVRYLDYLVTENVLQASNGGLSWQWDMAKISDKETMPRTVGELLSKNISRLPLGTQQMLITAAHIGHQFSSKVLEREDLYALKGDEGSVSKPTSSAWRDRKYYASNALYRDEVRKILDEAVEEGLVVKKGKFLFQFPHDQIQKALYSMLSEKPKEQELLHYKIGWTVHNLISASEIPDNAPSLAFTKAEESRGEVGNLFMVVDNLNLGASYIMSTEERMEVVNLNYEASQMALQKSALVGAVKYARSGISLLEDDSWKTHYKECLSLYSLAAKLEHSTGNYVRSSIFIREIQSNGRTVVDQLPAFFTEIDVLGSRGDLEAALHLGLAVLNRLGVRLSTRPSYFRVGFELMRASRLMKKSKEVGFLRLPLMKDPVQKAALQVLASVWFSAFMLGTKYENLYAVASLRMASLSCQHGLSVHAPYALVGFAILQSSLGNFEGANDTANIALQLVDSIDGAYELAPRTWLPVSGMIFPWVSQSLRQVHSEFLRSYHLSLSHGDLESAYYGIVDHVGSAFHLGMIPLETLESQCIKYVREMEEFQINMPKWMVSTFFVSLRDLLGKDRSSQSFQVEAWMNEMKVQQNVNVVFFAKLGSMIARLVMQTGSADDKDDYIETVSFVGAKQGLLFYHFSRMLAAFYYGLACFELAHQKAKFARHGRKMVKQIADWHKGGAKMAGSMSLLLQAEALRYSSRTKTTTTSAVEKAYLDAAKAAASDDGKCTYAEARCYEMLSNLPGADPKTRAQHKEKAIDVYTKWGAQAKVDQLRLQD